MTTKHTFKAVIQDPSGGGAYVEIPFDVETAFGTKRPKVKAMIDGIPYRGSLVRMKTECHILGIRKEIRSQIGKSFGDEVTIALEEDTEPRIVEFPKDLALALEAEPGSRNFFDKLSYTHQKEYVTWIEDAKKDETRQRRILKTIEMLNQKNKGR